MRGIMAPDFYYGHCACNMTGCGCSWQSYHDTASNVTNYYFKVAPLIPFSVEEFLKSIKADWREWLSKLSSKPLKAVEPIELDLMPILWRPALPRGFGLIPKFMRI